MGLGLGAGMALLAPETPALGGGEKLDVTFLAGGGGGLEAVLRLERAREALSNSFVETDEVALGEVGVALELDFGEVGLTLVPDLAGVGLTLELDFGEVGLALGLREAAGSPKEGVLAVVD